MENLVQKRLAWILVMIGLVAVFAISMMVILVHASNPEGYSKIWIIPLLISAGLLFFLGANMLTFWPRESGPPEPGSPREKTAKK